MSANLEGRVAVITGGSRGLGRETAFGLANAGADIVIVSRKQAACDAVAEEITSATGRRAVGCACHVGRWSDVTELVDTVYSQFPRIDVLVNNAGIAPTYSAIAEASEELFDKTIAVNLKGPFRLNALFGTRMKADGRGSIINVSSTGAVRPQPHILPYAAAKAGLNALTIGMAHAFGPEVRVNGVMPGPFLTDISASWDMEAVEARVQSSFALGRVGRPSEVVGAMLYFASDESSYTTGSILTIHGGEP